MFEKGEGHLGKQKGGSPQFLDGMPWGDSAQDTCVSQHELVSFLRDREPQRFLRLDEPAGYLVTVPYELFMCSCVQLRVVSFLYVLCI